MNGGLLYTGEAHLHAEEGKGFSHHESVCSIVCIMHSCTTDTLGGSEAVISGLDQEYRALSQFVSINGSTEKFL